MGDGSMKVLDWVIGVLLFGGWLFGMFVLLSLLVAWFMEAIWGM
jgi:hypothetical protein